ncbi:hypothetical protein U1Q18_011200 [Sarracenia purpurea var. burkii]
MSMQQKRPSMEMRTHHSKSGGENSPSVGRRQATAANGGAKESSDRSWSPLLDIEGILPPYSAVAADLFGAPTLEDVKKTMHEVFADIVDELIDSVLYGPTITRRLPAFEERFPS